MGQSLSDIPINMTSLSIVLIFVNFLLLSSINEGDARGHSLKHEDLGLRNENVLVQPKSMMIQPKIKREAEKTRENEGRKDKKTRKNKTEKKKTRVKKVKKARKNKKNKTEKNKTRVKKV